MKINYDASWDASSNMGGIGIVARDNKGREVGSVSQSTHWAKMLEAKAILKRLKLAMEKDS